jgi:hypothetical protein
MASTNPTCTILNHPLGHNCTFIYRVELVTFLFSLVLLVLLFSSYRVKVNVLVLISGGFKFLSWQESRYVMPAQGFTSIRPSWVTSFYPTRFGFLWSPSPRGAVAWSSFCFRKLWSQGNSCSGEHLEGSVELPAPLFNSPWSIAASTNYFLNFECVCLNFAFCFG